MPIYEYFCDKCEKKVEIVHSMSDEGKKIHKECGKELNKVFSALNILYKGDGWARRG